MSDFENQEWYCLHKWTNPLASFPHLGLDFISQQSEQLVGSSTLCSKNDLLLYSPMLLNVAYYAIESYPLFHIMLYKKKSDEIHHTTQNSCFRSSQF